MTAPPLSGEWVLVPLTAEHVTKDFASGVPEADAYLREEALLAKDSGGSATHVLVRPGELRVSGYFTLLGHQIQKTQLTQSERRGKAFRSEVPASLLAWIARDQQYRGEGLGELLLLQSFRVFVESADLVGSAALVLDARSEKLATWYEGYGFRQLKAAPLRRLYMTTPEVRGLGVSTPQSPEVPVG